MTKISYVDKKHSPKKNELVVEFKVKPAKGISMERAAEEIAKESSIGTWTDLATMKPRIAKKLKPSVFSIKGNTIQIAYPLELFEAGSIPQLLSSIAGNIYGMKYLERLRLENISFSAAFVNSFNGPKFGIKGVRKTLGIKDRPLVGTIVKPKVGLNEKEHAKVAYNAWLGGCDLVKDDENLTSMKFNSFKKRVTETLKMRDKSEEETGEKKAYMPNVTAETNEMLRRAKFVKQQGGRYVMIDILTAGWAALQSLREADLGLIIHAHRAGHAALTRIPDHGISMLSIAKLARLAGVDQLHVGAIVGKMHGSEKEVKGIVKGITEKSSHLKSVFPVCSGGLHPGKVEALLKILGTDIIIQAGGGIHGHKKGTIAGAKAMRQAVEAALQGIPAKDYALMHKELAIALKQWGAK